MTATGQTAPAFELPDTAGRPHSLTGAPATVLVFTCNHCPYALAWHERMLALARDYAERGVQVLAINANDATTHPRDSLEAMRARVEAGELDDVPYLHDESQQVAREYDARTTPDVFIVDAGGTLRYRGALDSDHDDPSLDAAWARAALDAILDGRDLETAETKPVGCSIKWRKG